MASWKLGPALATGNTVVLKPSARTPLSALAFADILAEIFPAGVVNVLSGSGADIGDALVTHPTVRMVSITGDTVTGKRIARLTADSVKRLHLELGGKAPVIVFDDADVDLAAETLRMAGYWNSGQDCTAATRVIAGPKVYDKFVSALADQVRTIKWGDPAEGDDIEMGSMIAQAQAEKVQGMVDRARAGAEVVVGGERPDRAGSYYTPTVIAGPDQKSEIIQDEIFGPVVTVQRFSDEDQAIAWANDTPFGLASSVFTTRHRQGHARRQGARVRARLDQRALHAGVGDPARRRQAVRLGQGRFQVRARGLHVRQARDDQHWELTPAPPARRSRRLSAVSTATDLAARPLVRREGRGDRARSRSTRRSSSTRRVRTCWRSPASADCPMRRDGRYLLALTGRPLRLASPGDGAWRALAAGDGRRSHDRRTPGRRSVAKRRGPITAALVCRPGPAMTSGIGAAAERDLGADQSNTSVVLGDAVLLKAYRRFRPGLNPELELVAFLSEQAGFAAVPPLAGYAEVVSAKDGATTVAIAQAFVADGADAYEALAESLTAWLLAPGEVSVEFATEVVADLGTLTAGMHAALADVRGVPGFEPRDATRDDLRRWGVDARAQFDRASAITPEPGASALRDLAPRIAEELTVFDALTDVPRLTRIHADYHLGQVLIAPDGFRVIDFEGEPFRDGDARFAQRSPLRDVASMLRSIDHVGRSAVRRAEARNGGPLGAPGLDIDGWLRRGRERFLEAYRAGLREARAPVAVDPVLIRAFEIEKECYEFVYASTYLPSWLWAPTEGMRGLFDTAGAAR